MLCLQNVLLISPVSDAVPKNNLQNSMASHLYGQNFSFLVCLLIKTIFFVYN